jgi:non-reducing end alpha-L-arabinofuranosidase
MRRLFISSKRLLAATLSFGSVWLCGCEVKSDSQQDAAEVLNDGDVPGNGGVTDAAEYPVFVDASESDGGITCGVDRGLPCDIYAAEGGPCVAAHSTVRALLSRYAGPLYQVKRGDGTTKDIGLLAPGGFANSAEQDSFCASDVCTISLIYDQSGKGNHLTKAPAGGMKKTPDNEADATALPVTVGGHTVYGIHMSAGIGYRNNQPKGTAIGDNAETMYMITSGDYSNDKCCFDYGNAETNSLDNGEGTMEAIYFGSCSLWGKGYGNGPWVMGDLENGLWGGNVSPYNLNKPVSYKYVTAMIKADVAGANHWAIKVGNAQTGSLRTMFDGVRPTSRYNPMRKEGAIILGTGGDNSNGGQGNFFEGLMTTHFSTESADTYVQANIVATYGR